MRILELFSGTASFSNVCKERGHQTFTVDNDSRFNPDLCINIMDFQMGMLPFYPDVIWSSPPCQKFSIMTVYKNWIKDGEDYIPKNDDTKKAVTVVTQTIGIINNFLMSNPKLLYFIENPRAMLRKMLFMDGLPRKTITYCQYGLPYQKPTDIWTNCASWVPRPMCSPKSPCHIRAPRGSSYGVQGMKFKQFPGRNQKNRLHPIDIASQKDWKSAKIERAIVPRGLCEEICIACEKELHNISRIVGKP